MDVRRLTEIRHPHIARRGNWKTGPFPMGSVSFIAATTRRASGQTIYSSVLCPTTQRMPSQRVGISRHSQSGEASPRCERGHQYGRDVRCPLPNSHVFLLYFYYGSCHSPNGGSGAKMRISLIFLAGVPARIRTAVSALKGLMRARLSPHFPLFGHHAGRRWGLDEADDVATEARIVALTRALRRSVR